jgi:fumarylacetoacetate (FAA) hydrolase family protein
MFAPIKDRDAAGHGFTHHDGDLVTITAPELGTLANRTRSSADCEPWTFGIGALMANLARRGVLAPGRR